MIPRLSLVLALSILLCPAVALAPPAPLPKPKPLLPESPPVKPGDVFAGQPGVWVLDWGWPRRWDVRRCFEVTLGRDGSWKAHPGGWRGKWTWDARTKKLSVYESRPRGRAFQWEVRLERAFWENARVHPVVEGMVKGTCVGRWASVRSWGVRPDATGKLR
jgi:hypothetical protein